MSEIRDAALHFEGVKIALNQDKNGFVLKLSIHPNEVPEPLLRDWVGSRYMVALVKLNDHDQPVVPDAVAEGKRMVMAAGALCRNEKFQRWLVREGLSFEANEDDAKQAIYDACKISSRSELADNEAARKIFQRISGSFEEYMRGGR